MNFIRIGRKQFNTKRGAVVVRKTYVWSKYDKRDQRYFDILLHDTGVFLKMRKNSIFSLLPNFIVIACIRNWFSEIIFKHSRGALLNDMR